MKQLYALFFIAVATPSFGNNYKDQVITSNFFEMPCDSTSPVFNCVEGEIYNSSDKKLDCKIEVEIFNSRDGCNTERKQNTTLDVTVPPNSTEFISGLPLLPERLMNRYEVCGVGDVNPVLCEPFRKKVQAISHGTSGICFATEEGKVYCFGHFGDSYKGSVTFSNPTQLKALSNIEALMVRGLKVCGLSKSGDLTCVLLSNNSQEKVINKFSNVEKVFHNAALDSNGILITIDMSDTESVPADTPLFRLSDSNRRIISANSRCMVDDQNTTYCYGRGGSQLFENSSANFYTIVPVTDIGISHKFTMISGYEDSQCGLTVENQVFCWGSLTEKKFNLPKGQVVKPSGAKYVKGFPELKKVINVRRQTCGISVGNDLFCTGSNLGQYGSTTVQTSTNGRATSHVPVTRAEIPEEVADYSGSDMTSCAITVQGRLYCWGDLTAFGKGKQQLPILIDVP